MRSLVTSVRPSYRIQRVLAKGSLRRSSLFDVKRLAHFVAKASDEGATVGALKRKSTDHFSIIVSKKTAKTAVVRNRIKRRLKEGLRLAMKERAEILNTAGENPVKNDATFDYVIIGKLASEKADFEAIKNEMKRMLGR